MAAGRLVLNVLMSVAQWERETISERTHDALQYKKSKSEKNGGQVSYGFTLGPDKLSEAGKVTRTLVPCPQEQEVIALVRQLRDAGETMQAIADALNGRGIRRREGGEWNRSYVFQILKRAA
jgi:DNA invertase Pin-like site-specific DNA recombinase